MADGTVITLYLSEWQKRMIRDHVKIPSTVSKIIIGKISKKELVMYRQPMFKVGAWNLYLTDEQINHVSEALRIRTKISALNISPDTMKSKAIAFK